MLVELKRPGPAVDGEAPTTLEKITLIRPAILSSSGAMSDPVATPVGLAYLAAAARDAGFPVQVIDATLGEGEQVLVHEGVVLHGLTLEETVDRVAPDTTIIGLSCMFSQDWPGVRVLAQALRERFPEALIVAGGEHVTAESEFCLRDCPPLDLCVRGEGEETLLDVLQHARHPERLRQVRGIAYLHEGRYVQTPGRQRIRAIDEIPPPAWDLFPMEAYLSTTNGFGVNRGRSIGIVATRGCPYQCTFCSNAAMYGTRWIARDPDDVLDEIEGYIEKYAITNVDFYDLTMVLKRKWILDFCRKIEERGLDFTWQLPSGTRSEVIDEEVAAALYRTGCRNICYAPESGSEDTLKRVKKRVQLDRLVRSIQGSLREGMVVRVNLIIGFPHETRRHVWETMKFTWKLALLGVHDAGVYQFSPYPGTELFHELREEGKIGALDDAYFRSLLNYKSFSVTADYCRHLGPRELAFWRSFGMASFFALSFAVRPWRFAQLVRNVARNKANTALETRLSALLRRRRKQASGGFPVAASS